MKAIRYFFTIAATLFAAIAVSGQPGTRTRPDETILLYADSFEGCKDPVHGKIIGHAGFEMSESNEVARDEDIGKGGSVAGTSEFARMDLYFPRKANGQMIIVCPGGGYQYTSTFNEGIYVADWLLKKGITVCVVKYRVPEGHWEIPLTDIQNAFRYCRAKASEWEVKQIGVMGFSAGGHLAASVSTLFVDEVTRPDFSVLIYPVISLDWNITHRGTRESLTGKDERWSDKEAHEAVLERFSLHKQVTADTPPTFLAHSSDDGAVPVENSIIYYRKLVSFDIPAEMHIFPAGQHGWGFSADCYVGKGKDKLGYAREEFWTSLERWLEDIRR